MPSTNEVIVLKFINQVKQGKIHDGSYPIAKETVELLKEIILNSQCQTAEDLLSLITNFGRRLIKALPLHSTVGNMVRRILKIIREEYHAASAIKNNQEEIEREPESLHKIITSETDTQDFSKAVDDLKPAVLEHIGEFQMELETCADNIAQQAKEHIHSNEIIMTIGNSDSVKKFLEAAALERKFEVIIAETSAYFPQAGKLAVSLAKKNIETVLIPDSSIFAMMSRVNKVIIGTNTVMANGCLRTVSGTQTLALAAKHYSVPVIVLAPLYKLSPIYPCSFEQDPFNIYVSPESVLPYEAGQAIHSKVHVINPVFDYVPPELVSLFVSNMGGHTPSYIYRLQGELYNPDDNDL